MSLKSKLSKLDKGWDDTKDEFGDSTGGLETIPSGNYVVNKVKAELVENSKGNLMIKRSVTIQEGDEEGNKAHDNMNIETERGPEFLLKWLNLMGIQVDSLKEDLEDALKQISDNEEASYGVTIKEDGSYNKIFFNKCIDEGDTSGSGSSDAGDDGDDDMPDIDDLSGRKLKKFIKENELDVDPKDFEDEDDLRDAIEEAWPDRGSKKEKKEEKTASRRASRKSKGDDDGVDEKTLQSLRDLSDAFGIKINEDDDLAEIKKTLKDYDFKKKDLEKSEITALKKAGLEKTIK